ncbi:MAG TPA: ABC transporter permease [Dehalococcoidales bacterium]|nr:ABC transporter permease [Dehalococcoidales bacterium]
MASVTDNSKTMVEGPPRVGEWRRFRRVFFGRPVVMFGTVIILLFIICAIFAPLIAPHNPFTTDLSKNLQRPSSEHLLGTDQLGRDSLSRIIYGARTSLLIGFTVVAIASAAGMLLGTLAGFYGGWVYNVIMRLIDALMAFPMILLALVVAGALGEGMRNVLIALSIAMLPVYTRLMCGQVLSVKENDYILASRASGARDWRIMLRHIMPNCFPPLIVLITMMLGMVILTESVLSFMGIGIVPPTPAWGSMVNEGRLYLRSHPILSFAPGLVLMLAVFAFNMVGDGLRDALDPRLRGAL